MLVGGRITGKKIDDLITQESVLCTDSAPNYKLFAELRGLECKQVNIRQKKRIIEKIYHVQHVNQYHGQLKEWIGLHFNGVATKYMDEPSVCRPGKRRRNTKGMFKIPFTRNLKHTYQMNFCYYITILKLVMQDTLNIIAVDIVKPDSSKEGMF